MIRKVKGVELNEFIIGKYTIKAIIETICNKQEVVRKTAVFILAI